MLLRKIQIYNNIKNFLPKHHEIRDFEPYTNYTDTDKVATYLELKTTSEEQLATFKYNHRRKIKKAYKNGLEVFISVTLKIFNLFIKYTVRICYV